VRSYLRILPVVALLVWLSALPVAFASGETSRPLVFDLAARVTAALATAPVISANSRLEIGIGSPRLSLHAWTAVDTFPQPTPSFGGAIAVGRDWLSLGFELDHASRGLRAAAHARAVPPAWLLHHGIPSLAAGLVVDLRADLREGNAPTQLELCPSLTVLLPGQRSLLASAFSVDLSFHSTQPQLRLPTSRLVLDLDLESVIVSGALQFAHLLHSLTSASMALQAKDSGLFLAADVTQSGSTSRVFRMTFGLQWGGAGLLPARLQPGAGSGCVGGICY